MGAAVKLYDLRLSYSGVWEVDGERFGIMQGRCEGSVSGSFAGANRARIRADGGYEPHVQGVIETDDGATLLLDLRARGRVSESGDFCAAGTVTHTSADDRYRHLNDLVCALAASSGPDDEEIAVEVYETLGGAAPS